MPIYCETSNYISSHLLNTFMHTTSNIYTAQLASITKGNMFIYLFVLLFLFLSSSYTFCLIRVHVLVVSRTNSMFVYVNMKWTISSNLLLVFLFPFRFHSAQFGLRAALYFGLFRQYTLLFLFGLVVKFYANNNVTFYDNLFHFILTCVCGFFLSHCLLFVTTLCYS